ncbi:GldG family protein [Candidatus Sumerlaeota bacterium]|nr:GldG family protein [Candidatus Sumerlaeota bacterium]
MISLLGKILKALPVLGGLIVAAAVLLSIRHGQMDQTSIALIGAGFFLLLTLFLKIEPASLRYYANLIVLSALMLANLALVFLLARNHDVRWDLTRNARWTLAPQTRQVLENLKKPVEIEVVATQNEPYYSYFRQWTALGPRVAFKITNPYRTPEMARMPNEEIRIDTIRVRNVEEEGRISRIQFKSDVDVASLEKDVLNAVLRVTQDERIRIYFVSRHGEKSPDFVAGEKGDLRSISKFADVLYERAMEIRIFDLQADRMVPDDCDLLAIVGPLVDYEESEIAAIRKYLDRGGSLLACLDPPAAEMMRLPRLRGLLAEYGMGVGEDFVADYAGHSAEHSALVPLIRAFNPGNEITENLEGISGDLPLYLACAVGKTDDAPKDMTYVSLMLSSDQSWNVTLDEYTRAAEEKVSIKAPPSSKWAKISLAAAAWPANEQAAARRPRMVVFGDSDFLSNARLGNLEATLGYFSVNWAVRQDALIALPPRIVEKTPMLLNSRQRNLISILSVVVIPFSVFFGGLTYTTIRRRKR